MCQADPLWDTRPGTKSRATCPESRTRQQRRAPCPPAEYIRLSTACCVFTTHLLYHQRKRARHRAQPNTADGNGLFLIPAYGSGSSDTRDFHRFRLTENGRERKTILITCLHLSQAGLRVGFTNSSPSRRQSY